jgi:hypothetical protein
MGTKFSEASVAYILGVREISGTWMGKIGKAENPG